MCAENACFLFNRCLTRRRDGDWRQLLDLHGRRIRGVVRQTAARWGIRLAGADLDEAVQDLFFRLLTARKHSFLGRSEAELWSYLGLVARNLVVDRLRAGSARKRKPDASKVGWGDPSRRQITGHDPEARLLAKERRDHFFERCLEIVRCDSVILELRALGLALLEGWTSREIARHLQDRLNPRQVDQLVCRLRRHLAADGIRLPRRLGIPVTA